MAFDSAGTLYTWNEPFIDRLNTVDLTTGVATEIGPNSISQTRRMGLDIDSTDTIYIKTDDDVYTVNATTGATTFIINLDDGFFNILAFDAADTPYTLERDSSGGSSIDSELSTFDLTTGVTTLIGLTGVPLTALAFSHGGTSVTENDGCDVGGGGNDVCPCTPIRTSPDEKFRLTSPWFPYVLACSSRRTTRR